MSAYVLVIMLVRGVDGGVGVAQIDMPSRTACEREAARVTGAPRGAYGNSTGNTWVLCVNRAAEDVAAGGKR